MFRRNSKTFLFFLIAALLALLFLGGCVSVETAKFNEKVCNKFDELAKVNSGVVCAKWLVENFSSEIDELGQANPEMKQNLSSYAESDARIRYFCQPGRYQDGVQLTLEENCGELGLACDALTADSPGLAHCKQPECGNSKCETSENNENCPADCPKIEVCNNDGACTEGETLENCPADCETATEQPPVSQGTNTCVSITGDKGSTGKDALPKVRFYWGWGDNENELPLNACENIYCDPAQFSIVLMKKIKQINDAGESYFTNPQQYENITKFNVNLIGDNYNENFLKDFANDQGLLEAPGWFSSATTPFNKYLLNAGAMNFNQAKIESGKYSVEIIANLGLYARQRGLKQLFYNSEPNATIRINLTKISSAENNPFYFLPINGGIGLSGGRNGYGTKFVPSSSEKILITTNVFAESPSGAKTVQTNFSNNDFEKMNTANTRSVVFALSNKAETMDFYSSSPVQVLGIFDPANAANGLSYQLLSSSGELEPTTGSATTWKAFASESDCKDSQGGPLPHYDSDEKQPNCDLGTGKSFLVKKGTGTYKTFYSTIFYVPQNMELSLKTCSNGSIFATKNAAANETQTIALEKNPQDTLVSIQSIFSLVEEKKICVVTKNGATKFFWNERKLPEEIQAKATEFTTATLASCTGSEAPEPGQPECDVKNINDFTATKATALSEELSQKVLEFLLEGSRNRSLAITLLTGQYTAGIPEETQQETINYLLSASSQHYNPGLARNLAIEFNPGKDYGACDTRKENPKPSSECGETVRNIFEPSAEPIVLSQGLFDEIFNYLTEGARNKGTAKEFAVGQLQYKELSTDFQTSLVDYIKSRDNWLALKVAKELMCGAATTPEDTGRTEPTDTEETTPTETQICTPAAKECQESTLRQCKEDGSGWAETQCPNGCQNEQCLECIPNTIVCTDTLNNKFNQCNAEGTAWSEEQKCGDILANSSCAINADGIQGCYLTECKEDEKVSGGETGIEACSKKGYDLCKEAKAWEWFTTNKKTCDFRMAFWGGSATCCKITE
ncbi:MAG: hypothetical protein PHD95_01640 [Candidatus ainarchaeum sp.]|nr:hypothetical protein [Candidatus ainarchaeum sp.]